jgi:hypothetical protein
VPGFAADVAALGARFSGRKVAIVAPTAQTFGLARLLETLYSNSGPTSSMGSRSHSRTERSTRRR